MSLVVTFYTLFLPSLATYNNTVPEFQVAPPENKSYFVRGTDVCVGDFDIRNDPDNLKILANCRVIEGSLSFVLIDQALPEHYKRLSFPKLHEITGFFLVYRVSNLTTLSNLFPNLAVIGGDKLIFNYALVVYEMHALDTIGLYSLSRISRGAVRIEKNPRLCYIDTISWASIMNAEEMENNIITDNKLQSECANYCPTSDRQLCRKMLPQGTLKELCWDNEHCQRICKTSCPHSCLMGDEKQCCHEECQGGCYGLTSRDCVTCKHLRYEGSCVRTCPRGTVQILNRHCILPEACPSHYKLFQEVCSEECPTGFTNDSLSPRSCAPCSGACPKTCDGATIQSVTDMERLVGCTVIDGTLKITLQGGENTVKKLETYLGLIEEIRGALVIIRAFSLVTLSFLKNLRTIGGSKDLERGKYSVFILDNRNLQDLFPSLQANFSIEQGKVFFHFNPKLCYYKISNFAKEAGISSNLSTEDVSRNTNGDFVACSAEKIDLDITVLTIVGVSWKITEEAEQVIGDLRNILGYVVSWRVAPFQNLTEFEGEETCGVSVWDSQYTDPDETTVILVDLKAATQYAIYVRSYTLSGADTGVKSDIHYFTTREKEPSAPTNVLIHAVSSSKLRVIWGPPEDPNGNVTRYQLTWSKQAQPFYGDVDFCQGKLPSSHPEKNPSQTLDPTTATNVTQDSCNCESCEDRGDLKDSEQARNQITFENTLHNIVFIKSNYLEYNLSRPDRRTKREVDTTSSPSSNAAVVNETPSINSTATTIQRLNGSTTPSIFDFTEALMVNTAEIFMERTFEITGLGHFEQYMVEVKACNSWGCGSSISVAFGRTLPKEKADDIVSEVFANITFQRVREHHVFITWEPPPAANGVVLKYQVEVVEEDTIKDEVDTTTPNTQEKNSTGSSEDERYKESYCISAFKFHKEKGYTFVLRKDGNFSARVRAVTLAGEGSWTNYTVLIVPPIEENTKGPLDWFHQLPWIIGAAAVIILAFIAIIFFRYQYHKDQTPDGVLYASVNPEYLSTSDMYVADDWEFPREKLNVVKELGKGGFGMVYEGIAHNIIPGEEKTRVAVKSVQANASVRDRIEFLNEASVMKTINTHHVVRLLGVVSKGQPAYVIMEFMAQGDLKNWLRARRPENQQDLPLMERKHPPTYAEVIKMAAEIADGVAYLGANKYVHRDLSARNCLVSADGTCKVADFGLARDIYQSDYYRKERGGMLPIRWMAPESVKDGVFTTSSDVWSYGILLWEIASLGEMPYGGLNNEGAGEYIKQGRVLNMPEGCPDKLQELMMACWAFQEKLRPTFLDIVQSLESTCLLPPSFAAVSFYHSEQRNRDQRASGGSLEGLERVNMLHPGEMNDYTYMEKANGGPKNGLVPVNGSIPRVHGSPTHVNSSADNASPVGDHGSPQFRKCTEC